jgi:hypothetical protein
MGRLRLFLVIRVPNSSCNFLTLFAPTIFIAASLRLTFWAKPYCRIGGVYAVVLHDNGLESGTSGLTVWCAALILARSHIVNKFISRLYQLGYRAAPLSAEQTQAVPEGQSW